MRNDDGLNARAVALDLVDAVLERRRALDTALEDHGDFGRLPTRDRAFVRHLVATVLRRRLQLDALIDACLDRPLPRRAREIGHILRLGTCQILFMQTADHAAVSTAVELARARGHTAQVKLVNAVLRRMSRDGAKMTAAQDAARINTPTWLWESWSAAYGPDTCRRIAEAHLSEPPLDLSVVSDPSAWAARLEAERLPTGTLRRRQGGAVTELPGFAEGAWWVQDAAARAIAALLGDVAGRRVIDLCAAPGGKTAFLAAAGAVVTAVDRSAARLARLEANLSRLGLAAEVVAADAATWQPPAMADAVLLDAPCSATGTIRRHPDIPWTKSADDVVALATTQARLFKAAADMVAPGGVLVYATCSLQPEEGPDQVAPFLNACPDFALEPLSPAENFQMAAQICADGAFRSLPCHLADRGGMDGFFAARFCRRA